MQEAKKMWCETCCVMHIDSRRKNWVFWLNLRWKFSTWNHESDLTLFLFSSMYIKMFACMTFCSFSHKISDFSMYIRIIFQNKMKCCSIHSLKVLCEMCKQRMYWAHLKNNFMKYMTLKHHYNKIMLLGSKKNLKGTLKNYYWNKIWIYLSAIFSTVVQMVSSTFTWLWYSYLSISMFKFTKIDVSQEETV